LAGLALALAAIAWLGAARKDRLAQPIALFTTLPILWAETGNVGELVQPAAAQHWARAELARRGQIVPLDLLAGTPPHAPLEQVRRLVIAQPRPLAPQENVALDRWVRGGGAVLLIADPALTEPSAFPLGDPRRPQVAALFSPILTRWGLELTFDEAQPFGPVVDEARGIAVPTNLSGRFAVRGQSPCRLWGNGLVAVCAIGKGRVVAVADAAVLERDDPAGMRRKAMAQLLDIAFAVR
jgi:hypothetical protein